MLSRNYKLDKNGIEATFIMIVQEVLDGLSLKGVDIYMSDDTRVKLITNLSPTKWTHEVLL